MSRRVATGVWAGACVVIAVVVGVLTSAAAGVGVGVVLFLGPVVYYWRVVELSPRTRRAGSDR